MSEGLPPTGLVSAGISAFAESDWRGPSAQRVPTPPRRVVSEKTKWLIGAKPGNHAQECVRARAILTEARSLVRDLHEQIARDESVDLGVLDPVVEGIMASIERDPMAMPGMARLKMRHEYTFYHSVAVCALMVGLGRALKLDEASLHDVGMAGLLHDVGKAKMPPALLDKPGPLSDSEYDIIKKHVLRGHDTLLAAGAREVSLDVVLHHHERLDGSGYPHGKAGFGLSRHARMAAICDVYDAMTSTRSYKGAWSPGEALEDMRGAPQHFDATILKAFAKSLGPYPTGTLVRLVDGRLAVVMETGQNDPLDPTVMIVMDAATLRRLPPSRKENAGSAIVSVEYAERLAIEDWPEIRSTALRAAAA